MHGAANSDPGWLMEMLVPALKALKQRRVRGQVTALVKLVDEVADLLGVVHHAVQLKDKAPFRPEVSLAHHLLDRRVSRVVAVEFLVKLSDEAPGPAGADPEAAVRGRRAQVNQNTTWLEDTMCLLQGMNHALLGNSSERPREDGRIKKAVVVPQVSRLAHMVCNAPLVTSWELPARLADALHIWIEGLDVPRSERGQPQGQSTVATADLDHAPAIPLCGLLECPDLGSRGIHCKRHTLSLLVPIPRYYTITAGRIQDPNCPERREVDGVHGIMSRRLPT